MRGAQVSRPYSSSISRFPYLSRYSFQAFLKLAGVKIPPLTFRASFHSGYTAASMPNNASFVPNMSSCFSDLPIPSDCATLPRMQQIAALYVQTNGVYFDLDGVDPWDESRDARAYRGPHPVVAHPPCQRWGRYWSGGPNPNAARRELGDDGGCFAAALNAVRTYGGVLEHPEASHAFEYHRLLRPVRAGWRYNPHDDS